MKFQRSRTKLGLLATLAVGFSWSAPLLTAQQRTNPCPKLNQILYENSRQTLSSVAVLAGSYACYRKPRLACAALASSLAWFAYASHEPRPLKWDWLHLEQEGNLAVKALEFPKDFLWGVGTSAQQVEGDCTNNSWSKWEKERIEENTPNPDGTPFECAGNACNQWDEKQIDADIQKLKELGVNAYRFSIEWSKIEPAAGIFPESAMAHYDTLCQKLIAAGIRPVITLHHYTDPIWFMYGKGGFEKAENNHYFVRFCSIVFEKLNRYNPLWLTFNSPSSYALNSYQQGQRPPGKKSMQTAMEVLANMLHAHVDAYHAMKKIAGDQKSEIGILHNIYHLELGSRYNPLDYLARSFGNRISHTCVYDFFNTGFFKVWVPGQANVNVAKKLDAVGALDFIGLNYYSHGYMTKFKPTPATDEQATDNPRYTIYAEGLYRAVQELSQKVTQPLAQMSGNKEIPIYITENGVGTTDDSTRDLFSKRTLYALSQSCKAFKNVKGYIHWSFIDNYEWGSYTKKYGVYAVDLNPQSPNYQQRTFKPGAQHFKDVMAFHRT